MSSKGVAIVTGAAQGIGRGIALRLAADGFDVALADLASNKHVLDALSHAIRSSSAEGAPRRVLALSADVAVEEDVKSLVVKTVEELGAVDVMVANAGVILLKPFIETTVADFDRLLSINVRGTMLCYKYAAQQMIAQGRGGRIIGACSIAGKKGAIDMSAYCATKFAIRGLTQSAAQELGKHGITVNAYAPGSIETPLLDSVDEVRTTAASQARGEHIKLLAKGTTVGYNGTPADIASLVSYIASKEAHFITGQSILADGGVLFD